VREVVGSAQWLTLVHFQLNLSAFYAIAGSRRGCVARVKGVSGGVQGVYGVFVCQTRVKLSWTVDELKPLVGPAVGACAAAAAPWGLPDIARACLVTCCHILNMRKCKMRVWGRWRGTS